MPGLEWEWIPIKSWSRGGGGVEPTGLQFLSKVALMDLGKPNRSECWTFDTEEVNIHLRDLPPVLGGQCLVSISNTA